MEMERRAPPTTIGGTIRMGTYVVYKQQESVNKIMANDATIIICLQRFGDVLEMGVGQAERKETTQNARPRLQNLHAPSKSI